MRSLTVSFALLAMTACGGGDGQAPGSSSTQAALAAQCQSYQGNGAVCSEVTSSDNACKQAPITDVYGCCCVWPNGIAKYKGIPVPGGALDPLTCAQAEKNERTLHPTASCVGVGQDFNTCISDPAGSSEVTLRNGVSCCCH